MRAHQDKAATMRIESRDRHWPGFINVRSLVGVTAAYGPIAPGRLYRSDEPHGDAGQVRSALDAEGIRTVLDLRSEHEARARAIIGSGLPSHVMAPLVEPRMDHLRDPASEKSLLDLYRGSIARNGRTIAAATREILRASAGGVLVHCAAGKDRTGILIAVILDALGARPEHIFEDYVRTETNLAPYFAEKLASIDDLDLREQISSRQHSTPATMHGLVEDLHLTHGGGAAYLRRNGFTSADLVGLAQRLCS
jgi:protein-tyrosine phosphatase